MTETSHTIPRTTPRFAFIAEAEMNGIAERARVTKLSARGCYIDTIMPVTKDTALTFRIHYGCSSCEFSGKVLYTHAGFGMGVVFGDLNAEQRTTLNVWLDELKRKSE